MGGNMPGAIAAKTVPDVAANGSTTAQDLPPPTPPPNPR